MAEYSDIPQELQTEFLLKQSPTSIISHCNINKYAKITCSRSTFWTNYISELGEDETGKLVLEIAKQSQTFVLPLFKAIEKRYKTIEESVVATLLFLSIMRNDTNEILYFSNFLNRRVNAADIRRSTNKIIQLINKSDYRSEKYTNTLFMEFYRQLSDIFDHFDSVPYIKAQYLIHEIIYGKLTIESLQNLPAWLPDEESYGYDIFIVKIVSILARKSNIDELLNILYKYAMASNIPNAYLEHIADQVSAYLPTNLYIVFEILLKNLGPDFTITLGKYFIYFIDKDHLKIYLKGYYITEASNRGSMLMSPEEYAEAIYESELAPVEKAKVIELMLESNDDNWSMRVKKRWGELIKR